jgi:hypothetical protein
MLEEGKCAEARQFAQERRNVLPALYEAAAAACMAAFNDRGELWAYAQAVAARPLPQRNCFDRGLAPLLLRLVKLHRQQPTAQLRRKPVAAGVTFPCPRILSLTPEHGPAQGGYPLQVTGVHLPPVVVIHFQLSLDLEVRDIRITTRSTGGGTKAVITVPGRLPGTESGAAVYPEGWPLLGTNTPAFIYDELPKTAGTTPPATAPRAPTVSPAGPASQAATSSR